MTILWKYFFLGVLITVIPLGSWAILTEKESPQVLGTEEKISTPTPTASPTPMPTITPTPKPTPSPSPTPTPTLILPSPITPQEIHGFIERFAAQYAQDPNVLRHIAVCESGFNPLAINGPYVGLYQFGPTTWKNNRFLMGEDPDLLLRFNAEESTQTAAYMLSIRGGGVWPNCMP